MSGKHYLFMSMFCVLLTVNSSRVLNSVFFWSGLTGGWFCPVTAVDVKVQDLFAHILLMDVFLTSLVHLPTHVMA